MVDPGTPWQAHHLVAEDRPRRAAGARIRTRGGGAASTDGGGRRPPAGRTGADLAASHAATPGKSPSQRAAVGAFRVRNIEAYDCLPPAGPVRPNLGWRSRPPFSR